MWLEKKPQDKREKIYSTRSPVGASFFGKIYGRNQEGSVCRFGIELPLAQASCTRMSDWLRRPVLPAPIQLHFEPSINLPLPRLHP